MAEKIKKGDFVEIDYNGFTKEENYLFDTTDEKKAEENQVHSHDAQYGPAIICVGKHQLLGAIDDSLIDTNIGEERTVHLTAEKAFGKKDASLLKIVPMSVFKKENIQPMPGLQVSIDGLFGVVKTSSGGRVIVDFNHPLAGKDVYYVLRSRRIIADINEKIVSMAAFELNIPKKFIGVKAEGKSFSLKLPFKMPDEIGKKLEGIIKGSIHGIDKLDYIEEKPKMPKDGEKDAHGRSQGDEHFGHHHA